jgi:hypothetical protein
MTNTAKLGAQFTCKTRVLLELIVIEEYVWMVVNETKDKKKKKKG